MRYLLFLILTTFGISYGNNCYAYDFVVDGIAYNILSGNSNEVEVTAYTNKYGTQQYGGDISIPSEVTYSGVTYKVTTLGSGAFSGAGHNVKSISMPNSIVTIGGYAFSELWDITSINIPNSVVTIGNAAFRGCQGLVSIEVPNNVLSIGKECFDYCLGLKTATLGISLKTIGESAFSRCSELKSVNIPSSVESIGDYAFTSCTSLQTIEMPSSVTNIGKSAFRGCTSLKTAILSPNIEKVDDYLFCDCSSLETIGMDNPNTIQSIGRMAFFGCHNLKTIPVFTSLESIGDLAFDECYYLSSITFPSMLNSIGSQAFYNCPSLSSVISEIIDPFPLESQFFYINPGLGIPIQAKTLQIPAGTKQKYIDKGWVGHFNNVIELPRNFQLSITSIGQGSVKYGDSSIKNSTMNFSIEEGSSIKLSFSPDNGYKIKSVKVNDTDVTSNLSNNSYTISNITSDTNVDVEFEAIPPTTYNLSMTASGNGQIVCPNDVVVRNETKVFPFEDGGEFNFQVIADEGYTYTLSNTATQAGGGISGNGNNWKIHGIKKDASVSVSFMERTKYDLTIKATGNGSASFEGTTVRNNTSSISVYAGTTATISFSPDNGYRIKNVIINNKDVTSSISNGKYTIPLINSNTTVAVEFEAIPPTTYTLSIKATGNGSASYNGTTIRAKTNTFTVNEGTSVTISITPDNGCRIKSVKENNTNVTSYVSNGKYTISSISRDTNVEVEFEAIPPTTYTLSIKATGNGSASYDGNTIRGKTSTFTVNEGSSASITFSPDDGYRIKSVKLNSADITSSVSNNQYTISNITANTTLEIEFEAIPITTYTLSITASGSGSASYNGTSVRSKTSTFTVNEGTKVSISLTPDNGYRIKSVKENDTNVTSYVSNGTYTINSISRNTTVEVEFEAIPVTTYTLSISATGNGYVAYDGNIVRGKTSSFTVNGGTNATIKFSADEGNRLKSVKLNGTDITYDITGNQYVVNNISANTSIEVVFEAIPTYSLNITATGNGSITYNGTSIRNQSQGFALQEGSSAVISITPDNGYRIASVKVNSKDATSQVANGKLTITSIQQDTNVEVTFEAIPATTCTLSITATGNGVVTYDGKNVRNQTSPFTVAIGTYATVLFAADEGYRLKRVKLDGKDVTADVVNDQYTTSKLTEDATLLVEFEAVPTYSLTVKSSQYGSVRFGDEVVKNETKTFSVTEGTSAVLTFTPDNNGRLQSITLNGTDITQQLSNGQYTISNIRANQDVEAVFTEDVTKVTYEGVAYTVTSYNNQTVVVAAGNYGNVLVVPASFTIGGLTWKVEGVAEGALMDNKELAAIVWKPALKFTEKVSNPNLLLYVKEAQYASPDIQNVILGDMDNGETLLADNITLVEADNDNDFYCPLAFIAKHISYEHNYSMISGHKSCQGWETLVLPFDVSMMISPKGTELVPYTSWKHGSNLRPYWLYELTAEGWKAANGIKANTPYIISMPNNEAYELSYNITGDIQFVGYNVQVVASDKMTTGQYGNKRLVPNYRNQKANNDIYVLNVNNLWNNNTDTSVEGSAFIRGLRQVRPFEAYIALEGGNAGIRAIPVFEDITTGIMTLPTTGLEDADAIYNLNGQRVNSMSRGIYIQNGRKVVKKK